MVRVKSTYNLITNFAILAGVIDQDYRGELKVVLFNFSEEDFQVNKGDRIAQLICERYCSPQLVEAKVSMSISYGFV